MMRQHTDTDEEAMELFSHFVRQDATGKCVSLVLETFRKKRRLAALLSRCAAQ
jgi:hypothetical protein